MFSCFRPIVSEINASEVKALEARASEIKLGLEQLQKLQADIEIALQKARVIDQEMCEELMKHMYPMHILQTLKNCSHERPKLWETSRAHTNETSRAHTNITVFSMRILGLDKLITNKSFELLNNVHYFMDKLLVKYGLCKLDQGQCSSSVYTAVSGLFVQDTDGFMDFTMNPSSPHQVVDFAKEVLEQCIDMKIDVSIGIHIGSCRSGLMGDWPLPRFIVCGEAIDIANELQMKGIAGSINVSDETTEFFAKLQPDLTSKNQDKA